MAIRHKRGMENDGPLRHMPGTREGEEDLLRQSSNFFPGLPWGYAIRPGRKLQN